MKKFLIALGIGFLVVCTLNSCQKDEMSSIVSENSEIQDVVTKSSSIDGKRIQIVSSDYLAAKDPEKWGKIIGLEKRFGACAISEDLLADMGTEEMANLIVHYPLNYLIFAYNDPLDAVNMIVDRSQLHKQFLKRKDAANIVADIFSSTSVDMSLERSCYDNRLDTLSYANEMFLDYFVASGLLPHLGTSRNQSLIIQAAKVRLAEREGNPEVFSQYSITPLNLILANTSSSSTCTIYTYFGKSLIGIHNPELSESELDYLTNTMTSNHPFARRVGLATNKYNCHSYAWHSTSDQNDVWLNARTILNIQLSKYWTDDLYDSCSSSSAKIAYYSVGDHSAINAGNGKYLSKWGAGPVMEHELADCPYVTTNMQYYGIRTTPLLLLNINGPHNVIVGQTNHYTMNQTYPGVVPSWYVRYMDMNYPTPFTFVRSSYGGYDLTCNDYGLFKMYVDGYYQGNNIVRGHIDIVATPY